MGRNFRPHRPFIKNTHPRLNVLLSGEVAQSIRMPGHSSKNRGKSRDNGQWSDSLQPDSKLANPESAKEEL